MIRSSDGVLGRFTRDLTAEARGGRLEPVRCRADEIARVIDILLRHGKNNPALVGPAGVGKTAIVEGLAQRLARGEVPLSLRDVRILAVDHVALLAGTTYRGQYEERIRGLVAETSAAHDAVLFIDELHNLIGQGTALGVAMDAANMLKPALVRGDFRVIGATTDDEYQRWVCGDPALERRFQKVTVRELSAAETLEILRARKERLERHHNVVIDDEAIVASVQLTDAHLTDRNRPDRAIDALDEACAHAHAVAEYPAEAQRLIRARRDLLRTGSSNGRAHRAPPPAPAGPPAPAAEHEEPVEPPAEDESGESPDGIDQLARDGFAALQRFGAELEAMLVGAPNPVEVRPAPSSGESERGEERAPAVARQSLADLDADLARRLLAAGIVVRGADVARVVALTSNHAVTWGES